MIYVSALYFCINQKYQGILFVIMCHAEDRSLNIVRFVEKTPLLFQFSEKIYPYSNAIKTTTLFTKHK